jgi:hypothetical protein
LPAYNIIEGLARGIPGRGHHELLSLHFSAGAVLPAKIQASAAIAFKKDLRRDAGVKNFIHVFLVDPWCAELVHRSLQDDEVGRGMFAYFFIGFVAALDHGLGNGVPRSTKNVFASSMRVRFSLPSDQPG